MERLCHNCGQPFEPKRADALYCGQSCRQQAYMTRKTDAGLQNPGELTTIPLSQNLSEDDEQTSSDKSIPLKEVEEQTKPAINAGQDNQENQHFSSFLNCITQKIESRQRELFLAAFDQAHPHYSKWINTRYLSLVESLLAISETSAIPLKDLKDIGEAFYQLLTSEIFGCLPVRYPYIEEMTNYYHSIQQFCDQAKDETITVRFTRNTRADLITSRYELAAIVPWIKFNHLNFAE